MSTIKCILIDPWTKTVEHVDIAATGDRALYPAIKAAVFGPNADDEIMGHVRIGAKHGLYLDDNGLRKDWDRQRFFSLGTKENHRDLAGRAVIVHDLPDGDAGECKLPIRLIRETCRWLDAREVEVPAPTLTTLLPDGSVRTTPLEGVSTWTYARQPGRL